MAREPGSAPALRRFIRAAEDGGCAYICDVRDAFEQEGTRPFHVHVKLYGGGVRRFALKLPACEGAAEARFVESYLNATIYNAFSALGAREVAVYVDFADAALLRYARSLREIFQVDAPLSRRGGYGKCLNVNERTLASVCGAEARFGFRVGDLSKEPEVAPLPAREGRPVFAELPARAGRGMYLGIDVGGTDVKLAASVDGRLCAVKEYDWFPAEFSRAEQLIEPLLLLARLMRAAACLEAGGLGGRIPPRALERSSGCDGLRAAAGEMEAELGDRLRGFDGIGLSFPDVVIRDRIVGGETHKTHGMRANRELDYEAQFAQITALCDRLRAFARPGGAVVCVNDGPMAAFTAAVERAAAGGEVRDGFFAHTLGTDLGTGWVLPDGSIPELPLEVYNFIVDLGSFDQWAYDPGDVRSVRNDNTGLPGTLQKYSGQSGVFRLAARELPEADPRTFARALDEGLFAWDGGRLTVPAVPVDMRKPCLEFFMRAAEDEGSPCAEIFRKIGEYLAVTWRETQYILEPACRERVLFGRMVKHPACFARMCEGARRVVPGIELTAAGEALANTDLMRQLARRPDCTVAQFAQAVGAIYYACLRG